MLKLGQFSAILILTLLPTAPPLGAQNLLTNGEFDLDTLDWFASGPVTDLDWDTADHDVCGSASGSALATNGDSAGGQANFVACVLGITAGAPYSVDGFLRIPPDQTATGGVLLRVYWVDSAAHCDGGSLGIDETSELPTSNPGVWIHKAMRDLVAPAGAQSALVGAMVFKSAGADALQARFDGVHLVAGNGYLFGDGFDSDSTCRWDEEAP